MDIWSLGAKVEKNKTDEHGLFCLPLEKINIIYCNSFLGGSVFDKRIQGHLAEAFWVWKAMMILCFMNIFYQNNIQYVFCKSIFIHCFTVISFWIYVVFHDLFQIWFLRLLYPLQPPSTRRFHPCIKTCLIYFIFPRTLSFQRGIWLCEIDRQW